ncbi:MAG: type IV pilin protein [Pseudoxanthomonas sp.]
MQTASRRRHGAGFTLIELMIVVAVIAILAAIAYASYSHYLIKTRRNAAAVCLQERAQYLERYYTTNMTYLGVSDPAACDTVSDFYTLSYSVTPTATAYTIQAVPVSGSAQAKDTTCGTLTINQAGVRTANGSTSLASECW